MVTAGLLVLGFVLGLIGPGSASIDDQLGAASAKGGGNPTAQATACTDDDCCPA